MKRYKRPSKEDFYNQFITLNKTNKQLSEHYDCSENVIHRWKNYYKLTKPLELVLKSYIHKGFPKGHQTWNKGLKGHLNSENCKRGWFTSEQLMAKAEKSIGKPRDDGRKWLVCLTHNTHEVKNSRNGKIYTNRKREGYARYVLQQAGIEIPKGYCVYHIDGDYSNNKLGNLKLVTRAELAKLNNIIGRRWKNAKNNG